MPPRNAALLLAGVLVAGCGGDDGSGGGGGESAGARVVMESGCYACHRIGSEGSAGPGPDLSAVGARLDAAEIRGRLLDPPSGMPSFDGLPQRELDALVEYLAGLR